MPKYIIHCSTIKSYTLTVEAPNAAAVDSYYEDSDGREFHAGEEGGWTFHEVEELPESTTCPTTDVKLDEDGIPLPGPLPFPDDWPPAPECEECGGMGYTIGFNGPQKVRYACETCAGSSK